MGDYIVPIIIAIFLVIFVGVMGIISVHDMNTCRALGGVPITSQGGIINCAKKENYIDLNEWYEKK